MKYVLTVLLAIVFALIGKGIGRFVAKTHYTDDTSAILTVAAHRAALKKVGRVAIGVFVAWVVMLFLGSLVAPWITVVGWVPLITLNCCLAVLAGSAASLAALSCRPARWDSIQLLIEQRERLIEHLKRFIPIILVLLFAASQLARASDACLFVADPTPSVNSSDARDAKAYLTGSVFEATEAFDCKRVVSLAIGCEIRHAPRVWLDVPADLPSVDCSKVEPVPLSGHSRFWDFVRGVAESRKKEAVHHCEQEEQTRHQIRDAERASFIKAFEPSLSATGDARCSQIASLIRDAIDSGLYRLIVVVTDAIDNPPSRISDIVVPRGTRVVLILTRPNPSYARVQDGLARAAEWAEVPGVTVLTTAELRAGLWRSAAFGSQ